jgi:hypothetical protein
MYDMSLQPRPQAHTYLQKIYRNASQADMSLFQARELSDGSSDTISYVCLRTSNPLRH